MIKKLLRLVLLITVFTTSNLLFSQGNTCQQATPFCTAVGTPFVYPNVNNGSVGQVGPNYGCLTQRPNPSWFIIKTSAAGIMTFSLSQTVNANGTGGGLDVDFIAWGPFLSQTGNCGSLGTNTVGCSYSPASTETLSINSPGPGRYYIIMITNFTGFTSPPGLAGFIAITQTSGPASDCSISCPLNNFTLVGTNNNTNANIPNNSTVTCIDPFVLQPPTLPLTNPNSDILTPCIKVTYSPFTANINTNGTVRAYEGGTQSWATNCPTCAATVGGTVATAGNDFFTYYTQVDPAQQHDFSFCKGAGAIGTSTITLENCWDGTTIAGPTVWNGASPSCFTLTAPANTPVGTGTFAIAPATGSVGIVDLNWGLLYVDPSFLPGGQTYTVTYTFKGPGVCAPVTGTYVFSVPAVPVVSAITSQTVCSGASVAATNFVTTPSGGAYTWLNNNTGIGIGASGTTNIASYTAPTVGATTVGNFTVTPTQSGCIGTSRTFTITINPKPTANPGPTATITCANTSTALAGSGGGTYSWTGPGIVSGGATSSPTVNLPGTYNLQVTSAAGCTSTISSVVVSQNTVTPIVSSGVSAVLNCTLSNVNANATTATTPVSYAWSGSGITSASNISTITVNQPGTFNYTVTNTTNGCASTGNVSVTQNTIAPSVVGSAPTVLTCTTTSGQAIATTTTTPVTYNWTGPSITGGATTGTATINQPGTYNYTVTSTTNGCKTVGSVAVTQNTVAPVTTSTVSAQLNCTLTSVNASVSTTTTPVSYAWSGPGITSATNISTITVNAAGTYNYSVTAANGCQTIGSQVVTQNSGLPTVTGIASASLNCSTTTAQAIASTTSTPVTYNWSGPGITAGATTASATVNQPGTYNYTVTNTSNGCNVFGSVSIIQNTVAPAVSSGVSGVLNCTNTSVNANVTTAASPVSYTWTGPGITSSSTISSITLNQPGTYNYTVTNTSNNCKTLGSVAVTQNTATPVATSTVSGVLNCTLTSVNASVTTTSTPVSYFWNGPSITSGGLSSSATVNQPGTYNYTITNTSNGCLVSGSQVVSQSVAVPTVAAIASTSLNCTTTTAQVIASTTATPVSYVWTGTGITAGAATASATVNQPGTFNYTVTNTSNGCTASGAVAITQNTVLPNANASTGSIITCTNNAITLNSSPGSGVTYTWSAPGGSSIVSGVNTSTASASGTGVYTVTITDISNNCVKIATVSPTSNTTVITPTIATTPILTCANTTVTLNGSPGSGVLYSWTGPGTIAPLNLTNVNVNLPGSYVLTATNTANGCVGTTTTSVTQNTIVPTVTLSPTQTITCASPSVTISGASSPSTCTPSWAGVCGSTNSFTSTACATGTFVLTVTNPVNGCSNTGSVVVVSSSGLPPVAASNTGSITCTTFTAQVAATTTASPVTFNWTGPGTITSATSATTNVSAGGTYTCVVTNTVNGCASTITSFVPTNTTAVSVSVTPASSITCIVPTQTLNAAPTGAQYTYSWTGSGITTGSNTPNPVVNLGGNFVVTITNTTTGCSGTNTVNVPQDNAAPTLTINPSSYTTTCAVPSVTLVTNASVGTLTYSWTSPPTGSLNNITLANPVASGSGIFTVAVTNTVNGCSTALSIATVQVVPDAAIPTVTLSSNSASITCSNPTPSVSINTSTSSVTYSWSPTTGILSGATTANPVFNAAGSYSVVVTNTLNSCSTSQSGNVVTVVSNTTVPVISLSSTSNNGTLTCSTTSISITPTVTPGGNLTYTWSPGTGISTPINQANATFTASGIYTLAVTNTLTGCVSSSTATANSFTIVSNANTPTVTVVPTSSNTTIGCGSNANVTYSVNAVSGGGALNYSWTPGGSTTPNFTATTAGVYNVVVTNAASNCSTTAQFTVTGNSVVPNLSSNATANFPCGASNTTLSATSTNTNVSYTWTGPVGSIITGSTTTTPTVDVAGNYVVTVTDLSTGCTNSNTVAVSQTSITAAFTANPTSGIAPLNVDFTNQTVGATSYAWDFGNTSVSTSTNPSTVYNNSGTYTVILTAYSGTCSATASVTIIVEDGLSLEIPNVFTPNNDGINDVFSIKSSGIKEISLEIFNRWGQKMYEFTGPKAAWDGYTGTGGKAPDGTYLYFVKAIGYDDKVIEKHGNLSLFR